MRNTARGVSIVDNFPLYAIENNFIINKAAEITAAYKVQLPEIFTISGEEYELIHQVWLKAIKVLPYYSIVYKQDWFTKEKYQPEKDSKEASFLSRAYDNHFCDRPYLNHSCYLFLTKTRKGRSEVGSIDSLLIKGNLVPSDLDEKTLDSFSEAVDQFEKIVNDSDLISLTRLNTDDLLAKDGKPGIIEKHMSLSQDNHIKPLEDMVFENGTVCIGSNELCVYSIASTEDIPQEVSTGFRYMPFSTERSECPLSFAAPLGLLLNCNHVYNQYIFIDNAEENLRKLEADGRKMHSLSLVSSKNELNKAYIDAYIESANLYKLTSVKSHCNVMAWSDDVTELRQIKNNIGSSLSMIGCEKRHNTIDGPTLFWATIPGNAGDFPREESYLTFVENALCFFTAETNYKDSQSPFGIRLSDRLSGKPVHLDLSEIWMKKGIITNRNKFVLGPSGSGKSFYMNHLMRQYYELGSHIILVDMGNSYQGLCNLIHNKTEGKDGIYLTYTEENPISFNPFYTEDGVYDLEKKESLKTLILSLWKKDGSKLRDSESVAVSNAMNAYIKCIRCGKTTPSFNTFYEFVRDEFDMTSGFEALMKRENVKSKDLFDVVDFLFVLAPYYKGGEYDYLLNSDKQLDLLNKRFVVFEVDSIRDHKVLFPVVTLVIMESYINKMRRLKGIRKVLVLEEAWKAIAKEGMAEYVKYLYKTVRKYFGEVTVVTQEVDDIISSPIVKESIIANADCKILLDQRKLINKFDDIQKLLGLNEKEKAQILSINQNLDSQRHYKEVWLGFGGKYSAVYATEVSLEEYYTYTTEESEKLELQKLTAKLDGNLELAIKRLAASKAITN